MFIYQLYLGNVCHSARSDNKNSWTFMIEQISLFTEKKKSKINTYIRCSRQTVKTERMKCAYVRFCTKHEFQNFHPRSGENLNKIINARII